MKRTPATVKAEWHQTVKRKTPETSVAAAIELLRALQPGSVVALRDHAILAVLIYPAERVVELALNQEMRLPEGRDCLRRFKEKRGCGERSPCVATWRGACLPVCLLNSGGRGPQDEAAR